MKRRSFLQGVGWVLATLGVEQAGLIRSGDRYYQALAQPTSRKLALLVGINQYVDVSLAGCVTDVELQRELLIHRFGFQPSDILILTDTEATRQNIETAFIEHLIEQAQPDDVVVFHFSGYGSQIQGMKTGNVTSPELGAGVETEAETNQLPIQKFLLPADGILPTKNLPVVNGVWEKTLRWLLRSLNTQLVTTILDTSYADPGTLLRGNLRVRSRSISAVQLSDRELIFQKQLQQNQPDKQIPGVVIAAAGKDRLATEAHLDGFSAGLFTYALTQYLWQATPPTKVRVCLHRVREKVVPIAGKVQQPTLVFPSNADRKLLAYYLTSPNAGADGVVTTVESDGKTVQLWLGGLPIDILGFYSVNSRLTLLPIAGSQLDLNPPLQLAIRQLNGLNATAELDPPPNSATSSLQSGQLVREAVRVLPRNVSLKVALDASLERIEVVDATSAFASIPNVSLVTAGESAADCVLGRVQNRGGERGNNSSSPILTPQYGLFSPGRNLLPNTAGVAGEAVKTAIKRLSPQLQTLLAAKLLSLSNNEGSSRLGVQAILAMVIPTEQVLAQRTTNRAPLTAPTIESLSPPTNNLGIISLPIGSQIQYRLNNYSDAPVYFMLLGIDTNGSPIALLPARSAVTPNGWPNAAEFGSIAAGKSIIVPNFSSPFKWLLQGPTGLDRTQVIFSRKPFDRTVAVLAATESIGNYERIVGLNAPLDVARAVLEDLHQASVADRAIDTADNFYLDANAWATLNFIYEVV